MLLVRKIVQIIVVSAVLAVLMVVPGCQRNQPLDAVVAGGSMAPILFGKHFGVVCSDCAYEFVCDFNNSPANDMATCPNCGYSDNELSDLKVLPASHVKIQRETVELRRWDIVAFKLPTTSTKAQIRTGVKRIVALPNETMEIQDGDICIDGKILYKSVERQRQVRIPVFDSRFQSKSLDGIKPRPWPILADSFWSLENGRWEFSKGPLNASQPDSLRFENWRCCRSQQKRTIACQFEDYYAFNQNMTRSLNSMEQLFCQFDIELNPNTSISIVLALTNTFIVNLERDHWTVFAANDLSKENALASGKWSRHASGVCVVELTTIDGRFELLINERSLFQMEPKTTSRVNEVKNRVRPYVELIPSAIDISKKVKCRVDRLQVWRDIYYSDSGEFRFTRKMPNPAQENRRESESIKTLHSLPATGVNEYFLLGDNVPISLDSRNWAFPFIKSKDIFGIVGTEN